MLTRSFLIRLSIDLLGKGIAIFIVFILGRRYSVEEYGLLVMMMAYASVFYVLTDFGTHILLLRDLPASDDPGRIWSEYFGLKGALTVVSFIIGTLLFPLFYSIRLAASAVPVLVWMTGNTVFDFLNQTCNARIDLGASARITLIHRGMLLLFTLIPVLFRFSFIALCCCLGAGSALGAWLAFLYCHSRFSFINKPVLDKSWIAKLRQSFPIAVAGLLNTSYLRFGLLILPRFGLSTAAGLYGAAFKLFEAGLILPSALTNITTPSLSSRSASASKTEFVSLTFKMFRKVLLLSALAIPIGYLAAPWLVTLAYGTKYIESVGLYRILITVNAVVLLTAFGNHLFIIINRSYFLAAVQAAGLALSVFFSFFLIGRYGILGAPTAVLITELSVLIINVLVIWKIWLPRKA